MTGKMQRMRKLMYDTLPEGKTGLVVGNTGRLPTCLWHTDEFNAKQMDNIAEMLRGAIY